MTTTDELITRFENALDRIGNDDEHLLLADLVSAILEDPLTAPTLTALRAMIEDYVRSWETA